MDRGFINRLTSVILTIHPTHLSFKMSSLSPRLTVCNAMYAYLTNEVFNDDDTCIVLNQNSVSYRNFGRCSNAVDKYPYGDVAGLRKPDQHIKIYAQYEDRGIEGECIIKSPPLYVKGPTIATLITQYGIGRAFENNNIAQKIVNNSRNKDIATHLSRDSDERRNYWFKHAIFNMGVLLSSPTYDHIKNIIIPAGIGRTGQVDDEWLSHYLPTIHKFSLDMEKYNKKVIILLSERIRQELDEEFKYRNDDVVFHYKSLIVNLPVINENDLKSKMKTGDHNVNHWDNPNSQKCI